MENKPFIHVQNLSYSYVGEDEKPIPVLKNLSLDIREGEIFGIGGLAGQGKLGIPNGVMGLYDAGGTVEFDGKPIKKGEIMALENGKIVATGNDIVKMTYRLARSMKKKDSQFITVISGCDVSDEDAEKTTELVRTKCGSSVEVSHISGGQPVYYYMISVE